MAIDWIAHLQVGQESSFLWELTSCACTGYSSTDAVLIVIAEREWATVQRNANDQFWWTSAGIDPCLHTGVNAHVVWIVCWWVQWRVFARFLFPYAVHVVRHQVDVIEVSVKRQSIRNEYFQYSWLQYPYLSRAGTSYDFDMVHWAAFTAAVNL